MKQRHLFVWALVPVLSIILWQGQQPAAPQSTAAEIPASKIAVIDTDLFASERGIQQLLQQIRLLEDKYRPESDKLQKLQQEMQALQQEINIKASTWTVEVQRQKQEQLEEKQRDGKRLSEDLQRAFQKDQVKMTAPISERVRTYLQQYASRRGITMVLDLAPLKQAGAVPFIDQAVDITQDFINEYNKIYPAPQPQAKSSQ